MTEREIIIVAKIKTLDYDHCHEECRYCERNDNVVEFKEWEWRCLLYVEPLDVDETGIIRLPGCKLMEHNKNSGIPKHYSH